MLAFWDNVIAFLCLYLGVSVVLFLRSQRYYVVSRSANILQITLWANFSEILMILVVMFSDNLNVPATAPANYWLIGSLMMLSNSLMIFCYLIRAYRLYLVFNIDPLKVNDNSGLLKMRNRATQRWMIKALLLMISPLAIISAIVYLCLVLSKSSLGLYVDNEYGKRTTVHYMVDAFYNFLLQLSLILSMYYIRIVNNDFQMLKELVIVAIVLNVSNVFSLFIHTNRQWLYVYIARNTAIMVVSIVVPVVFSFIKPDKLELISKEMLHSVDLIMQHPLTLNKFEEFLKEFESGQGLAYLEIFLCCECYMMSQDPAMLANIFKKIETHKIEVPRLLMDSIADISEPEVHAMHAHCLDMLEIDYFPNFKASKQYSALCAYICRQEIYSNRLSQTSFLPPDHQQSLVDLLSFDHD
jgi:hypothetical protein